MPRWFLVLLTACALVLTASAVLHLRWKPGHGAAYLDTWRSRACTVDACRALGANPNNPFAAR